MRIFGFSVIGKETNYSRIYGPSTTSVFSGQWNVKRWKNKKTTKQKTNRDTYCAPVLYEDK